MSPVEIQLVKPFSVINCVLIVEFLFYFRLYSLQAKDLFIISGFVTCVFWLRSGEQNVIYVCKTMHIDLTLVTQMLSFPRKH